MSPSHLLPAGISPEDAITAMAGLSSFVSVLAVWFALLSRPQGSRRVKELAARREALVNALLTPRPRDGQGGSTSFMRRVVTRLDLLRSRRA